MSGAGAGGGVLGAGSSYQRFVHSALELTRLRTVLTPHPSQVPLLSSSGPLLMPYFSSCVALLLSTYCSTSPLTSVLQVTVVFDYWSLAPCQVSSS
jgi:hypothetical protein